MAAVYRVFLLYQLCFSCHQLTELFWGQWRLVTDCCQLPSHQTTVLMTWFAS